MLVAAGDRSNLGAPLVELADNQGFEVRVQIPDAYADRLRQYLAAGVEISATDEHATRMRLTRISGRVRQGQSGLDAFFELPVTSGVTPALGRVLETTITLPPEAGVIALPAHAIYESDRIYRVQDSRLDAITVERVGDFEDAQGRYRVLVRSPRLHEGDTVITTQLPKAISGLLVEPVNT